VKVDVSSQLLAWPRERIWQLLLDPSVLARLLPGVEKLEATAPDQYAVVVKMGVGAVRGTYTGKVQLTDQRPPESYRLVGEAKGGPGWAKGSATLTLVPEGAGTRIVAKGDAQIGGPVASVGQRMMEGVARSMANEFFQSIERELRGEAAEKVSASGFGVRVLVDLIRRFFARLFGRGGDA
jgi:carbon monoxide dehydrogenase subunit G